MSRLRLLLLQLARLEAQTLNVKGTDRVIRLLHGPGQRQDDYLDVVGRYGRFLIQVDTRSYLEWALYIYGSYEKHAVQLLSRLAHFGCVVLDVGANIGVFTLPLADAVGPGGEVHAFEPHPLISARLRENLALNNAMNVRVCSFALGSFTGQAVLHTTQRANQAASSLKPRIGLEGELACAVETLDSYMERAALTRLDLIKIDAQGADHSVLVGGSGSITRHKPLIYLEIDQQALALFDASPQIVFRLLRGLGYSVYRSHATRRGGLQLTRVLEHETRTLQQAENWLAVHPGRVQSVAAVVGPL